MNTYFLDTNIIIRYLTQDDPKQAGQARTLLKRAEMKEIVLTTSEGVIVEIVQVLSSKVLYNLPREQIKIHLSNILSIRGIKVANKRTVLAALDFYVTYPFLDFVDALNAAHMRRLAIASIATFDEDFDRLPHVKRLL